MIVELCNVIWFIIWLWLIEVYLLMASFTELWFRLVYRIRTDEEKEKIKLNEFAEGILVQYYIFFYSKITRCNNPKN